MKILNVKESKESQINVHDSPPHETTSKVEIKASLKQKYYIKTS